MKVLQLFPTPLFLHNLADEINASDVAEIVALGNDTTRLVANEGGNKYHGNTQVLRASAAGLSVEKIISRYLQSFLVEAWGEIESSLAITSSWVNFNPPSSSHHLHWHPNSIVSGVFYLKTNSESGDLVIHAPAHHSDRQIRGAPMKPTPFTQRGVQLRPKPLDLILFGSELRHSVLNNTSSETRVSLSFNTFYVGTVSAHPAMSGNSLAQLTVEIPR